MDIDLGVSCPLVVGILITICCILYVFELARSYGRRAKLDLEGVEGFASGGSSGGVDQRLDDTCYDAFYAKVYDPLVQPTARATMETKVPLEWFEKKSKAASNVRVADIG